ncbi:T9SS type A sorting domain-containing protein [bacterium]|nr:T9SS type A sorting domain-containing protein [bacterium]
MHRFIFALLLVTHTSIAQEVRGPYDLLVPATTYSEVRIASASPDTVEFVSLSSVNGLAFWAFSQSGDSLLNTPVYVVPSPEGWYSSYHGPIPLSDGWALLTYQVLGHTDFDYGYNRLILVRSHDGIISTSVLDSGRTHPFWRDSLYRESTNFHIAPRHDGGFFVGRSISYAAQDSTGQWSLRYLRELREYTYPDSAPVFREYPCHGSILSLGADTILFANFYLPDENSIEACLATRNEHWILPVWHDCVIRSYGMLYNAYHGLRLLTGYSPILQLKQLTFDGNCNLISEVNAVAERVISHSSFGYALVTSGEPALFGQIDADGALIREPAPFNSSIHRFKDLYLDDSGDTYVLWEYWSGWGYIYRFMAIPWYAVLDSPEDNLPTVPGDLSLSSFPNPFNSAVTMTAGEMSLKVFDIQGRIVTTLCDEFARAGTHELNWSPESQASGVYLFNLRSPAGHTTQKALYLK